MKDVVLVDADCAFVPDPSLAVALDDAAMQAVAGGTITNGY